MCGIVGYWNEKYNQNSVTYLQTAVHNLKSRGPDDEGIFTDSHFGFGHTRLSILDTSYKAHQPMFDATQRYLLIYNGEIYNFKTLKKSLDEKLLKSNSDTEILLYLLVKEGVQCIAKLLGFFAFAFYDTYTKKLILARDEMGIKPLYYYFDHHNFYFSSEPKGLLAFNFPRTLNSIALIRYLQFNYMPNDLCMLQNLFKLKPGHFLILNEGKVSINKYKEEKKLTSFSGSYEEGKKEIVTLLEQSVINRLQSDVPLGGFLSGGTDSSSIVSLASRHINHFKTYSIGYQDNPYFDETYFAEKVAKKFQTDHTTFTLSNQDLLDNLWNIIEYLDEPFADSSSIPVYILSKNVAKEVKVALSGDGADELFGGYYKHTALAKMFSNHFLDKFLISLDPIMAQLPQSRSHKVTNLFRRVSKYIATKKLPISERYWFLTMMTYHPFPYLQDAYSDISIDPSQLTHRKVNTLQEGLDVDIELVLPNDMLTKVDSMSMANSLEVRVPFLDKNIVNFAQSLPVHFKLKGMERKRILKDAFKDILPIEIYNRPKKGFEVPLLQWMQTDLLFDLDKTLFNNEFLHSQGIFNTAEIMNLRKKMLATHQKDKQGIIWALYIFQKWYQKTLM